jgi:cullin 4
VYKKQMQQQQQQQPADAASSGSASVEMEVQVLTTGYWPVYPQYPDLQLPAALLQPQELFSTHYKTKYQGRRMTWQYALGHVVVRCTGFPANSGSGGGGTNTKTYELVVGLCQALVLIKFNEQASWTLPALCQAVGLSGNRDEMERILQSLSLGKEGTRILKKCDYDANQPPAPAVVAADAATLPSEAATAAAAAPVKKKAPPRRTVHDQDVFIVSPNFESNQRRIRINNILIKESPQERSKTVQAVSRDRLYLMDAVLVRIMKARKTILHQTLIPQVLEQVKVPAQPADVKKRIESLIEREYMERDAKDRNRYNYLA